MATTEVLLIKPVEGLGAEGDEAKVKAGFARNYLIPQKIAIPLTIANRKQVEALKAARNAREAKELDVAKELKSKLEELHIAVQVKAGEEGKLFGAVTAKDLYEHISAAGVEVDKKKIQLHNPIKTLGKHETRIRLHPEVNIDLEFEVVPEHED